MSNATMTETKTNDFKSTVEYYRQREPDFAVRCLRFGNLVKNAIALNLYSSVKAMKDKADTILRDARHVSKLYWNRGKGAGSRVIRNVFDFYMPLYQEAAIDAFIVPGGGENTILHANMQEVQEAVKAGGLDKETYDGLRAVMRGRPHYDLAVYADGDKLRIDMTSCVPDAQKKFHSRSVFVSPTDAVIRLLWIHTTQREWYGKARNIYHNYNKRFAF